MKITMWDENAVYIPRFSVAPQNATKHFISSNNLEVLLCGKALGIR